MNETADCMLEREEYERIITITAYVSASLFICCIGCAVRICCCRR